MTTTSTYQAVRRRLDRLRAPTTLHNLVAPPAYFASSEWQESYRRIRDWFPGGAEPSSPGHPVLHLYLHVPYCEERCRFCMYYSDHSSRVTDSYEAYVGQLLAAVDYFAERLAPRPVDAAYVGGGTPSVLSGAQIERLLGAICRRFRLSDAGQYTFEMSPRSATVEKIEAAAAHGFNRVSLGVQSFDDAILARARRAPVSPGAVERLVSAALRAGCGDVNVDLMAGLPGESEDSLERSVKLLAGMGVPSISIYRYRALRGDEYETYGGLPDYLDRMQPRIDRAIDRAVRMDYSASPSHSEHVRLFDRRRPRPRWEHRHRYQTRFLPDIGNSLLGIGHGAWSFVRDERFIEMGYAAAYRGELLDKEVSVQFSDAPSRAAAHVVNALYQDHAIDDGRFHSRFGVSLGERYGEECAFLIDEGVGRWVGSRFEVAPRSAAEWAYYDKLFYPAAWLERRLAPRGGS
jgi:oxygen-independent coproporphyrinogen-3 oxidase